MKGGVEKAVPVLRLTPHRSSRQTLGAGRTDRHAEVPTTSGPKDRRPAVAGLELCRLAGCLVLRPRFAITVQNG